MSTRTGRVLSLSDKIGRAAAQPDRQSAGLREVEMVDEAFVDAFKRHFEGFDVVEQEGKVRAAVTLRNSLRRGAEKQLDAVVEMGRALLHAQSCFSADEWRHLLEGGEQIIGVPKTRASMYRAIADNIDNGRIPRDVCPESYSSVYILTCLEDWQLNAGVEQGVIHRTATRRQLQQFRQLPAPVVLGAGEGGLPTPNASNSQDLAALRREERRLRAREQRLVSELESIRRRFAEIQEAHNPVQRRKDVASGRIDGCSAEGSPPTSHKEREPGSR